MVINVHLLCKEWVKAKYVKLCADGAGFRDIPS